MSRSKTTGPVVYGSRPICSPRQCIGVLTVICPTGTLSRFENALIWVTMHPVSAPLNNASGGGAVPSPRERAPLVSGQMEGLVYRDEVHLDVVAHFFGAGSGPFKDDIKRLCFLIRHAPPILK